MKEENVFNIRLLREIEKYPYLYNYNLTEYISREITDKAWAEIAEKLQKTSEDCKGRWKNLRGSLTRNLSQRLRPSGHKVPKTFYLTKYMKFVLPFARSRHGYTYDKALKTRSKGTDNAESNLNVVSVNGEDSQDSWDNIDVKDNIQFFEENGESSSSECKLPDTPIVLPKHVSIPALSTEPMPKDPLETRNEHPSTSDHNDADKHFLLSLLPHIHGLSPNEKLHFQIKTLNVINEIMNNRENNRK